MKMTSPVTGLSKGLWLSQRGWICITEAFSCLKTLYIEPIYLPFAHKKYIDESRHKNIEYTLHPPVPCISTHILISAFFSHWALLCIHVTRSQGYHFKLHLFSHWTLLFKPGISFSITLFRDLVINSLTVECLNLWLASLLLNLQLIQ